MFGVVNVIAMQSEGENVQVGLRRFNRYRRYEARESSL